MKLVIYVNEHYEEEKALFDLDSKIILLKGDYYHDGIGHKINGYLQALQDLSFEKKEIEHKTIYIDSSHEHYDLLDFYNEDE